MCLSVRTRGLYLSVLRCLLTALNYLSIGYLLTIIAKKCGAVRQVVGRQSAATASPTTADSDAIIIKAEPWVIELYQLAMVTLLLFGLWTMPADRTHWTIAWWFFVIVAHYRLCEILVYSAKWLLVDTAPLHALRRSLVSFVINLAEIATCATIAGLKNTPQEYADRWFRVWANMGGAFKLEAPVLDAPYNYWFSIEAGILVLFLLACAVGGIQRGEN